MPDIFDSAALRAAVHDSVESALATIPADKRGAMLVLVDQEGARAVLAAKIGKHWQLATTASKPWDGPIVGQVALAGSW